MHHKMKESPRAANIMLSVLSSLWEDVDIEGGFLHLPDSKTGAKKIALPAPAALILSELPRLEGNPYVIVGSREGRPLLKPLLEILLIYLMAVELKTKLQFIS